MMEQEKLLLILFISMISAAYGNLYGDVQRDLVSNESFLAKFNGKILIEGNSFCSAVLIGPKTAISAAHCLFDKSGNKKAIEKFILGSSDNILAEAKIIFRSFGAKKVSPTDYVLLVLDKPLGEEFGYVELAYSVELSDDLMLLGYGFHKDQLSVSSSCEVKKFYDQRFRFSHDCDSVRGDSGGAILTCRNNPISVDDCRLVGIVSSENRGGGKNTVWLRYYNEKYKNLALSPESLRGIIEKYKDVPADLVCMKSGYGYVAFSLQSNMIVNSQHYSNLSDCYQDIVQ